MSETRYNSKRYTGRGLFRKSRRVATASRKRRRLTNKQDRTPELIAYIVHSLGGVRGRVILAKLVYMIDLESRGWLGHPISAMKYRRDHGGPYDRRFEEYAKKAEANGFIRVSWEQVYDYGVCVHTPTGRLPRMPFSLEERLVIDRALAQYGQLNRQTLLEDVIYQTPPMKRAKHSSVGSSLDMRSQNGLLREKHRVDLKQVAIALEDRKAGRMIDVEELLR